MNTPVPFSISDSGRLFDSHCHLQDARLADHLDAVMRRASAAGVDRMLCCGTCEDNWEQVRSLCDRYPSVIPAFGLHPWYARKRSVRWLDQLTEFLAQNPRAGVGEIGLDHAISELDMPSQAYVFAAQLKIAKDLDRPVSIHCRKAWEALLKIFEQTESPSRGFVIHSYSGPVELLEVLTGMGAFFSFSGSLTRSRNARGHRAAAAVPADRLLIETDAPDLMPCLAGADGQDKSKPNEPANLVYVLKKMAELRSMEELAVAELTWRNALRPFG